MIGAKQNESSCAYRGEGVKKSKHSQIGQGGVGETVERSPFSALRIRM
jgi:hypothetical protein